MAKCKALTGSAVEGLSQPSRFLAHTSYIYLVTNSVFQCHRSLWTGSCRMTCICSASEVGEHMS